MFLSKLLILHLVISIIDKCRSAKILALFPYNGRSHHIYFSSFVEELASREHDVVVVNYFSLKNRTNLRQISLQEGDYTKDTINVEELRNSAPSLFKDFSFAYGTAEALKNIANDNCRKLVTNKGIMKLMKSESFDVVIVEQFVTDCGFAIANILKAPTIGMTAHVLFPWTYSRLGADNNPAYVPNHFTGDGGNFNLWSKMKSFVVNLLANTYYSYVIQKNDNGIVREVYPDMPHLESLAQNMSLIMLNQYFPLTGSRVYGANVVEIGGMHVKPQGISDEALHRFLDTAENGVIYVSFGSVASHIPRQNIDAILKVIIKSKFRFVWKIDDIGETVPNLLTKQWLPQVDILCHKNVLAFVTHSGMLSSVEAMHCGVPAVSVPLFGDQFANAASAREAGLGVTVDLENLDEYNLKTALDTVLQQSFRIKVKKLSSLWKDRPMSPMDTAVYWVEYIARHGATPQLRPASVGISLFRELMIDIWILVGSFIFVTCYLLIKLISIPLKQAKKIITRSSKRKIE